MQLPITNVQSDATAISLTNAIAASLPSNAQMEFICYTPIQSSTVRLGMPDDNPEHLRRASEDPEGLLRVVKELTRFHNDDEDERVKVFAAKAVSKRLSQLRHGLSREDVVAVTSRVILHDGSLRHLPLLDMKVPPKPGVEKVLCEIAKLLGLQSGAIVRSGNSFHIYGFDLLEHAEWIRFMGRSLSAQPFVDTRYVGYRLAAGRAILRLTTCTLKQTEPTVACCF